MKLYIALSIAFLILISAALGAVGGAGISDTGSTVQQQAVSQQASAYPVPPISSSTEEQLAAEKLGLSIGVSIKCQREEIFTAMHRI